jgi:hypothetical protein
VIPPVPSIGVVTDQIVTVDEYMLQGEYVEVYIGHNDVTDLDINSEESVLPWFSIAKI